MSLPSIRRNVIIGAVVSAALVLAVLMARNPGRVLTEGTYSTYNTEPDGLKALYLLVKESCYRTERRQKGVETLGKINPDSLVFISVAPKYRYRPAETDTLESLVRKGATAILFMNEKLDSVVHRFGILSSRSMRDSVYVRQQMMYSNFFYDSLYSGNDSGIAMKNGTVVFNKQNRLCQPLYGADKISAVIAVPHGKGELVLFNSPEFITNRNIDRHQNADIVMNILLWSSDGKSKKKRTFVFDEYHQGYRDFESVISILDEPPVRAGLLIAIIGLALWVYSRSRRITRPVPVLRPTERNSQAYIDSVTQAYTRSGAHRLALHIGYQHIRRHLSARYKTTLESKWIHNLSEEHGYSADSLIRFFRRLNEIQITKKTVRKNYENLSKREAPVTDEELVQYFRYLDNIYTTSRYRKNRKKIISNQEA